MTADRAAEWRSWLNQTRATLAALAIPTLDTDTVRRLSSRGRTVPRIGDAPRDQQSVDVLPDAQHFFINNYCANEPALIELPRWPAFDWTLEALKHRLGDALVDVDTCDEAGRPRAMVALMHMSFSDFADRLAAGRADGYLMAHGVGQNYSSLAPLVPDCAPLPPYLSRVDGGQFFLGNRSFLSLHHDLHNALLCQIVGRKRVQLISPDQTDRVENWMSTFSRLGWVTDEMAAARGLVLKDFVLTPGQALFIPVGWWHAVKALELSASISARDFIWHNNRFAVGFPPG